MSELPEPDRLGEFRHPRESEQLIGQDTASQVLFDAFMSNRLHHAWLLSGPKGIGKATLAYQMAKFVLTYPDASAAGAMGADGLSLPADMPASRQIVAQGHPDLLVIRRPVDEKTKKARTVIPVDEVRRTTGFFGKSSGAGGWRVCIVDSADEMNANSANALLKVLEEPPNRSLFLLISHQPGRLLPTIRSRCRQLTMPPLGSDAISEIFQAHGIAMAMEDINAIDVLAEGSAGRALSIADGGGLELYRELSDLLAAMPRYDVAALHKLADKVSRRGAEQSFELLIDLLRDWVSRAVRYGAGAPDIREAAPGDTAAMGRLVTNRNLDPWVEVWEKIGELANRAQALNMDRKLVILNAFSMLEAASLGAPIPA